MYIYIPDAEGLDVVPEGLGIALQKIKRVNPAG